MQTMFLDEYKVTRASKTQLESAEFFFYQLVGSRGLLL